MKKYYLIISIIILSVSILIGCAQESENAATAEETEVMTTEADVVELDETEVTATDAVELEETTEAVEQADIFIEEQILIEENNVKMVATSIEMTADGDGYLNLQMENNTDQELTFIVDSPFVNECYVGGSYYETVKAGESKTGSFMFLWNDFYELYGAGDPAEIEVFVAVNTPDGSESIGSRRVVTIQTNKITEFSSSYDDSGEILYDGNGIKIVNKGINVDNTSAIICVENQSYGSLYIQAEDIVINGNEVSPAFLCANAVGQKQIGLIYFKDANWNDIEIGTAVDGEMTLQIYSKENESDAGYAIQVSETVKMTF